MKSSWCDTDGRRNRGKKEKKFQKGCWKVLHMKQKDCLDKDGMRPDVARYRRDRKEEIGNCGGGKFKGGGGGGVDLMAERSYLL